MSSDVINDGGGKGARWSGNKKSKILPRQQVRFFVVQCFNLIMFIFLLLLSLILLRASYVYFLTLMHEVDQTLSPEPFDGEYLDDSLDDIGPVTPARVRRIENTTYDDEILNDRLECDLCGYEH